MLRNFKRLEKLQSSMRHPSRTVLLWARLFVVLLIALSAVVGSTTFASARAGTGLSIQLTIQPAVTNVNVGQPVTYHIQFSCNGVNGACGAFTLTDVLNADFTNIQLTSIPTQPAPNQFTSNITGNTVTVQTPNLLDGSAYEVVIQAQVKLGAKGGDNIPNFATGTIKNPSESDDTKTITLTVNAPNPNGQWQVTKTQTSPAPPTNPTTNNPVSYNLCLKPTTQLNNEPLTGVSLVDTFPAGAVVLNSDGGAVSGNKITWPSGSTAPGNITDAEVAAAFGDDTHSPSCVTRNVTLQFNDVAHGGTFTFPSNPGNNTATATSNEVLSIGPVSVPINLVAPNPVPAVKKSIQGYPISLDSGLGRFFLHADTSSANVPIGTLTLVDNLPTGNPLTVASISSGNWATSLSTPQTNPVATIEYSTDGGTTWHLLGTADGTTNIRWNKSSVPPIPLDITNVHWVFASGVPLGFLTGKTTQTTGTPPVTTYVNAAEPEVDFIPNTTNAVSGGIYTNCLIPIYNGISGAGSCVDANVETDNVNIFSTKGVTSGPFSPEDQVPFTLTMKLTERSNPGTPMTKPQIIDTLPSSLTFAPVNPPNPLPAPIITYNLASCKGSLGTLQGTCKVRSGFSEVI